MEPSFTDDEIIAFLEHQMQKDEAAAFKKALRRDANLRLSVEAFARLTEAGRRARYQKLLNEIQQFDVGHWKSMNL